METTNRLQLPLLIPGQAQKEVTHNEALLRIDGLVQAVVVAMGLVEPPPDAEPGMAWIVADQATGPWAGQSGSIALATPAGWRFLEPIEGMTCWCLADGRRKRFDGGAWVSDFSLDGRPMIGSPAGGTTIDVEARSALATLLAWLGDIGLIRHSP